MVDWEFVHLPSRELSVERMIEKIKLERKTFTLRASRKCTLYEETHRGIATSPLSLTLMQSRMRAVQEM